MKYLFVFTEVMHLLTSVEGVKLRQKVEGHGYNYVGLVLDKDNKVIIINRF